MDGFIPRRSSESSQLGAHHSHQGASAGSETEREVLHNSSETARPLQTQESETTLGQASIHETLSALDNDEAAPKTRREKRALKRRKRAERKKMHSKRRRIIKWSIIGVVVAILAVAGYIVVRGILASNNIFQGNFLDVFQNTPLQQDKNGRSNFLIFGTAEDDEGGTHEGGNLTDSLMVLSVNQTTKDAYMISLPRDLWVQYDSPCSVGYEGKINAVYYCASSDGQNEAAGAAGLQKKVGEVLGLDIQYYAHLNFSAVVELVDAVGGVTVTIESNPAGVGILDRNFDWKCNYTCYYVKYDDGQVAQLDGEHALALSRARNAAGGYGLSAGNFDREKNQQKIAKALQEKALSAGTLTNINKVTAILDAVGKNLRTNIQTKEIRTLMSLGKEISPDSIRSLTLVDENNPLVTTGNVGGASVVQPVAGLYDFSAIQAYIAKNSSTDPVVREAAPIAVYNGTTQVGLAQTQEETLEAKNFTVTTVGNAPAGNYASAQLYQLTSGYDGTKQALLSQLGIESVTEGTPPVTAPAGTVFVIILGAQQTTE